MKKPRGALARKPQFRILAALLIISGLVVFGYVVTQIFAAGAASLYLSPASGSYTAGSTVAVQVMVNTGGESVNAVEADFTYPTSKLQFASIDAAGSAFDIDASSSGGNGSVNIARGKIGNVTGVALIATVRFTVLSSAGSAPLVFQNSSAVVRSSDNTDILGTSTGATYTVVVPTPAPTPTPTPTPAPTTAPGKTPTPTPGSAKTPTPTPTPTPTSAGGGVSKTTPTPSSQSSSSPTPTMAHQSPAITPTASTVVSRLTNLFKQASSSKFAPLTGLAVLLILLGLGVAGWVSAHRTRVLNNIAASGSQRPFVAPPTPNPATPEATPPPPAPNPQDPSQSQVFYPKDHPDNPGSS